MEEKNQTYNEACYKMIKMISWQWNYKSCELILLGPEQSPEKWR